EIGHGPESGLRLGPYRLERRIGQGGASTVWEAFDPRLARKVAIKVLHPHLALSRRQVERFEREARLAANLHHPAICKLLDVGVEDGLHYLVQELVPEGRTLLDLIAENELRIGTGGGFREMALIMHRVCEAVGAVHAQGVAHRDLKPNNILMRHAADPVVSDFGLSAVTEEDDLGLTSVKAGTPFYLSPEQVDGQQHADVRSDVFSLGVTLYECLTGRRPFEGESAVVVGRRIVEDEPVPPRRLRGSISRDLETICLVALEKDPTRRYPDASAMAADLASFLAGEPIAARPASPARRLFRALRARPVTTAGAVGALVIASAAAIYAVQVAKYNSQLRARSALLERTLEVAEFFSSGPLANLDPDPPVVLADLAEAARTDFAEDPEGRAQILSTVGEIYASIGFFTLAAEHYGEAADSIESIRPGAAEAADLRIAQLRGLEYDFWARRAIELGEPLLDHPVVIGDPVRSARVRAMLSSSYAYIQNDVAKAALEERFGAVTDQVEAALEGLGETGGTTEQALELRRLLARELLNDRRFEDALEMATRVQEDHVALYGREDLRTLMAGYQRGRSYGRFWANRGPARAGQPPPLRVVEELLAEATAWAGETSRVTLELRWLVAEFKLSSDRAREAFEDYDCTASHYWKWVGEENPRYLSLLCARAIAGTRLGATEDAIETLDRVIEVRERTVGASHFNTLIAHRARAEALTRAGRFEEAEAEFVLVWGRFEALGGSRGREGIMHSGFYLSRLLVELGRLDEAREWLRRTQDFLRKIGSPDLASEMEWEVHSREVNAAIIELDDEALEAALAAARSVGPERTTFFLRPYEIAGALLSGAELPPRNEELYVDRSPVGVEVAAMELAREYAAGDVQRARNLARRVSLDTALYDQEWDEGYPPSIQVLHELLAQAMRDAVGEDLLPVERQILEALGVE
ncbi:MAG: serine/threonine-protein kinase, partial [Planctomycetota bacterium]